MQCKKPLIINKVLPNKVNKDIESPVTKNLYNRTKHQIENWHFIGAS